MDNNIVLILQYFEVKNELRQKELDACLKINCDNPYISKIILLNEKIYMHKIMDNAKITQINISNRLTYNDVFKYSEKFLNINDIKILINTDIILDYRDIKYLKNIRFNNKVFALLRNECKIPINIFKDGITFDTVEKYVYCNGNCKTSQDVWIFNNIKSDDIYDFNLGIRGCDNRIAYLLDKNKYNITNPSKSIKIYHLHEHDQKSHENRERRNYKPFSKWEYKMLEPTINEEIEILKLKDLLSDPK